MVLITTHAQLETGYLGTSDTDYVPFNEVRVLPSFDLYHLGRSHVSQWIDQVVTRPVLEIIRMHSMHWFVFCCGAVVNVPSSRARVQSFAEE